MVWIIIGIVAVVILAIVIVNYNFLIIARNKMNNSFADVDTILKKRYDLIPNIVNTVKGYVKHESSLISEVTALRASVLNAGSLQSKVESSNQLESSLKKLLLAVKENYPDLKANQSFLALQNQLVATENELSGFRIEFNKQASNFNTLLDMFPSNIIGKMFGFKRGVLFTIVDEKERENVIVQF